MKTTINLSNEQVIEFINKQPDSRPVNFDEPNGNDECGCLLIHLFKERFPKDTNVSCAFQNVKSAFNELNIDGNVVVFLDKDQEEKKKTGDECARAIKTYGDLKKLTHLL